MWSIQNEIVFRGSLFSPRRIGSLIQEHIFSVISSRPSVNHVQHEVREKSNDFWSICSAEGDTPTTITTDGAWKEMGPTTKMFDDVHAGFGWFICRLAGQTSEGLETIRAISPVYTKMMAV